MSATRSPNRSCSAAQKRFTQSRDARHRREVCGDRAGRPEPDREQRALGAGTPAALMARAVDQGLELKTASDVKRAYPFRGVELAAGNRKQIDTERVDLGRYLSDRLRRVRVKANSA
ncbi:MAG TPA: hypothetical protein VNR86_00695, partial [Sphingomicrobium sp.]|nr:hypothetical protein [Sphingomicrobium sp.]